MKPTLIFDADDTLWKTHEIYDRKKIQVAGILRRQQIQVTDNDFVKKTDELSVEFGRTQGFSEDRFPTALSCAYEFFAIDRGVAVSSTISDQLWEIGVSVSKIPSELMPFVKETLADLSENFRLVLYTLGDEKHQWFRIKNSSLEKYFDRFFIVGKKGVSTLGEIIADMDLDISTTWMIGNSASSDIAPAQEVGLNCIWFRSAQWLYDAAKINTSNIYQVESLSQVTPIIQGWWDELNTQS